MVAIDDMFELANELRNQGRAKRIQLRFFQNYWTIIRATRKDMWFMQQWAEFTRTYANTRNLWLASKKLPTSTFDFAQTQLKNLDLRIGSASYRPDIAHNVILESRANGQKLSVGQRVTKGSKIDLVVGTSREGSKDD